MTQAFRCILYACMFVLLAPSPIWGASLCDLVTLRLAECPTVSPAEFMRIFRLELDTMAVDHPAVTAEKTDVHISCRDPWIDLTVENKRERKQRRIASEESPQGAAERFIAIAAAELVFSSWISATEETPENNEAGNAEKAARPEVTKDVPATSSASTANPVENSEEQRNRVLLHLSPMWQFFLSGRENLFGAELGTAFQVNRLLYIYVGGAITGGAATRSLGTVSLLSVDGTAGIGVDALVTSVHLGFVTGLRVGWGRLNGLVDENTVGAGDITGGIGGPWIRCTMASDTTVRVGFAVQSGYAAWGNVGRVENDTSVQLKGFWVSVLVSVVVPLHGIWGAT